MKNIPSFISWVIVMLLIAVPVLVFSIKLGYPQILLFRYGRMVDGSIIAINDQSKSRLITYQFTDRFGHRRESQAQVPHEAYDSAKEGDKISITYLPTSPNISEVTDGMRHPWIGGIIYSLFLLLTIIFLCFISSSLTLKKRRLTKYGRLVPAKIISIDKSRLVYCFNDATGLTISGKISAPNVYWERNMNRYIAVYYNPANPKDNVALLEGVSGFPQLISPSRALFKLGRRSPLLWCLFLACVTGIPLGLFQLYFDELPFSPNYEKNAFGYVFILIPVIAIAGPGIDSILALAHQAKVMNGFRTKARNICVILTRKFHR